MTGYLVVALIDLVVATFVPFVSRSKVAIAFSLMWLCFAVWSFNLYLATSIVDLEILTPIFHWLRFGMFFIAPCMIMFFTAITRTKLSLFVTAIIGLSITTSLGIYLVNVTFIPSILEPTDRGYSSAADMISGIHEINFVAASIVSILITIRAYRTAIFREKQRIKWLIVAIAIGCTLGTLSFNYSILFGMIGNVLGLSIMAYAVLRHHVVGVAEAISIGAIKAATALVILATFVLAQFAIRTAKLTTIEELLATLIIVFLLLEAYGRLTRILSENSKFLLRQRYRLSYTKAYLLKAFKNCSSIEGMILLTNEIFLKLVQVQDYSLHITCNPANKDVAELCLLDPNSNVLTLKNLPISPVCGSELLAFMQESNGPLFYDDAPAELKSDFQQLNASVCIPLFNNGMMEGIAVLGAPEKKEEFSQNDAKLLAWFSMEFGQVLHAVVSISELEDSLSEAEKTLSIISRINDYNHDIKTPFSNIEALLLAKDVFSPEEQHEKIMEQVVRGRALASTMTRIFRGGQETPKDFFDLNDLIVRVIDSFPTKSALVKTDLMPLPKFYGQEDQVGMLFLNLLNNAFEAQIQCEFKVVIYTHYEPDQQQITCIVEDSGAGIPRDQLNKIWHMPKSTKQRLGGSGLGLIVVKRIVEDHGGEVSIRSKQGNGTQFHMVFPARIQMNQINDAMIS